MKHIPNPSNRPPKDTKKSPFLNPDVLKELAHVAYHEGEDDKRTYTALELIKREKNEIPMLIESLIPQTGLLALVGTSDVGKSQLLRQLAIDVARSDSFLDFKVYPKHRKVVLICTEDDPDAIGYLIGKQSGLEGQGMDNIRIYFNTEGITDYLNEQLANEPADLVIVDAWADVYESNLNDANYVRQSLNAYRQLALKHKCAIVFLHHTSKGKQNSAPSKDNVLGSQGFEAKMRLVMELVADKENDNIRHLCVVKGNYLPSDMKSKSIMLEFNPETFTFINTKQQKSYVELTKSKPSTKAKIRFQPEQIGEATHRKLLCKGVFSGGRILKLAELENCLRDTYGDYLGEEVGGQRLAKLRNYLLGDLQLIGKHGADRSPNAYYYLTTDQPTNHSNQSGNE